MNDELDEDEEEGEEERKPWRGRLGPAKKVIRLARALGEEADRCGWEPASKFLGYLTDLEQRLEVVAVASHFIPDIMAKVAVAQTDREFSLPSPCVSEIPQKTSPEKHLAIQAGASPQEPATQTGQGRDASPSASPLGARLCARCRTHPRRSPSQRLCKACHAEAAKESRRRKRARVNALAQAPQPAPWPPEYPKESPCEWCHQPFKPERYGQRFCGNVCGGKHATAVLQAEQQRRVEGR